MTNTSLKQLGSNIKELRKGMGLTQQELADKTGISKTYIGQIERGLVNPSVDKLQAIAVAIDCTMIIDFVEF